MTVYLPIRVQSFLPLKLRQLIQSTNHTLAQIAEMTGVDLQLLEEGYELHYPQEYRCAREQRCNPIAVSTVKRKKRANSGYVFVRRPDWFTGAKSSKFIPEHIVVVCKALGFTELPKGMVVHHIDHDKGNNSLANLQLMTNTAHSKLHWALRKAKQPPTVQMNKHSVAREVV